MTLQEFNAWKTETEKSVGHWSLDQIHNKDDDMLIFKGGENGQFISVKRWKTGDFTKVNISIGDYTDAIPHIGEAMFVVKWCKDFENASEALNYLITRGGMAILRAIMFGRDMYRT